MAIPSQATPESGGDPESLETAFLDLTRHQGCAEIPDTRQCLEDESVPNHSRHLMENLNTEDVLFLQDKDTSWWRSQSGEQCNHQTPLESHSPRCIESNTFHAAPRNTQLITAGATKIHDRGGRLFGETLRY